MSTTKSIARVAGFLYLLVGIPAAFSMMYVPGRLIVRGDAAATVANILASQALFRAGIVSNLISATMFIFLALVLYRLFQGVSRRLASILLILVLIQIPVVFLNEVSSLAALALAGGGDFLAVFEKPQREALAMLFLNLHFQGLVVSETFWGLWLFPFGMLVRRSGFLPGILGIWLLINGVAYVVLSLTGLLWPQSYGMAFRSLFPALLGEQAILLWFLVRGARPQPLDESAVLQAAG